MRNLEKVKNQIAALGYYQLFFGIIGVVILIFRLANAIVDGSTIGVAQTIIFVILSVPFLFSIYAGLQCVNEASTRLLVSKINQALQVVSVNVAGFHLASAVGLSLFVGLEFSLHGIGFFGNFEFIPNVSFMINGSEIPSFVSINLVALFLVYKIRKYEKIFKQEKAEKGLDISEHLINKETI